VNTIRGKGLVTVGFVVLFTPTRFVEGAVLQLSSPSSVEASKLSDKRICSKGITL